MGQDTSDRRYVRILFFKIKQLVTSIFLIAREFLSLYLYIYIILYYIYNSKKYSSFEYNPNEVNQACRNNELYNTTTFLVVLVWLY